MAIACTIIVKQSTLRILVRVSILLGYLKRSLGRSYLKVDNTIRWMHHTVR